jgi:deoxyadenosine/deoxycytidine kinase
VEKFRHIAVEGPIGAGKTSLARRLAERLGAELLLEEPGENPFLARFYQDMARFALPTQLFFLFQRARRRAAQFERGIGEDYLALLAEGYARFFYNYGAAPVLIVNSENLIFGARDADLELLLARMRGMKSRREFFSLG